MTLFKPWVGNVNLDLTTGEFTVITPYILSENNKFRQNNKKKIIT